MKNSLLEKVRSKISLKISGKNIERFIHKLASNNIEMLKINYIDRNTVIIVIYKTDYSQILKLKSIYEINIVGASGLVKIRKSIKVNKILISAVIIGFGIFLFLTNTIFKVEVIHTSNDVRNLLINELKSYGISKYKLKKGFKTIENIKKNILDKYKDKIEWLEIEAIGTKYVIRVELRELIERQESTIKRNIVASKDALIKKVTASSGQIVKYENNYVKKGDTIISGIITLNDNQKGIVDAKGDVFGEVWYTVTVEYPFNYYEELLTGKEKNVLSFKFINKSLSFFNSFDNKKVTEKILLQNKLLPIKLVLENQKEIKLVDQVLTEEETISKALERAINQITSELKKDEYILKNKILKIDIKENKVVLNVFFSVYESILEYEEINIDENEINNQNSN